MPTALWEIAEGCIELDPRLRPSASTVASRLRAVQAAVSDHPALVPLPAGAVTHWPRSAEVTAPMTAALARVAWVPLAAAPVSPAATDAARFVAVPVSPAASNGPVSPAPASSAPVSAGPVSPAPPVSPAVPVFMAAAPPGAPDIIPPGPLAAPNEPKPAARTGQRRIRVLTGVAATILALLLVGAGIFLTTNVFDGDSRPTGNVVDGPDPSPSGTHSQQPPGPSTGSPSAPPPDPGSGTDGNDGDDGNPGNDGNGNNGNGNDGDNGNDGGGNDPNGPDVIIPGFPDGIGDPLPPMPIPPRR
jgi:hypothetical protein